jgi:hypothetical protein
MRGRGCRDFIDGRCHKLHVETYDGEDYLYRNVCHRYGRGRCTNQDFCSRLHTIGQQNSQQKLLELTTTCGINQTHPRQIEPLAEAVVSAIKSTPEDEHTRYTEAVIFTFKNSFTLQHPKIRAYLDIVCKDIQDSLH